MKEHSIFWPLTMIAAGMLWLMTSMGFIPETNLWALTHIFPLLLIALGVGMILRAYWRFAGMLTSLLVVAGAVLAVIYAPQFGWDTVPGWGWNVFSFDSDLGGRVTGSGVVRSETRSLDEFDSISIQYPAEIFIRQGKSPSVTIEAEDNLLPQLGTDVSGSVLRFENTERNWNDRVNPSKPVILTITVNELSEVRFSSAGKLLAENLKTDTLAIVISGAGDVTLTNLDAGSLSFNLSGAGNLVVDGTVDDLQMHLSGFGNFNGADLQAQTADVSISGAGNATIWVEKELNARISGAGSVDYYGEPSVSRNVSGVGSINGRGEK